MKKENGFTVYEENDPCSLDEYSKKHAEELEQRFEEERYDDSTIKKETEKNTSDIAEIQNNIESLQKENEYLRGNMLHDTAKGEIITVNDSAEWGKNELGVFGYSEQETRSGKNLFNKDATPIINYKTSISVLETGVRVIQEQSDGNRYSRYLLLDVSGFEGKKIRSKMNWKASADNVGHGILRLINSDNTSNTVLVHISASGNTYKYTIPSTLDEQHYLAIELYSNYNGTAVTGDYVDYTDVIITIDNEDMTYEPYGAMPSTEFKSDVQSVSGNLEFVRCGKNVLKFDNQSHTNEITVSCEDNIFNINGTILKNSSGQYTVRITDKFKGGNYSTYINNSDVKTFLKKGTYTISIKYLSGIIKDSTNAVIFYYRIDNNSTGSAKEIGRILPTDAKETVYEKTFEINNITPFSVFMTVKRTSESSEFENVQFEIMLERNDSATDYEIYNENRYNFTLEEGQEICAIKTTDETLANYVDKNGQMWIADYLADDSIRKKIPKLVLNRDNGNWGFGYNYSTCNKIVVSARLGLNVSGSGTRTELWCNYFKSDSNVYTYNNKIGCYINSSGNINFAIPYDTIGATSDLTNAELLELFLTWLDTHNIEFYYPSAEEQIIPYNEEQQKQYETLQNIYLQKGTNNIYCTNELMKNMSLEYMQSTALVRENDKKEREEENDKVRNAIIALGGVL